MSRNSGSSASSPPLETLIYAVLPGLTKLPDRVRQEHVDELVEFCEDILQSRLPSSIPLGAAALPDTARRMLATSNDALRFNSLWGSIERGRILSVPHKHLQFLVALAKANKDDAREPSAFPPAAPASASSSRTARPSSFQHNTHSSQGFVLGTPARPGPSTTSVLAENHTATNANGGRAGSPSTLAPRLKTVNLSSPPTSPTGSSSRSKADVLRKWRTSRGRAPFDEALLLRDTLYLLQGIDGRFVRFALAPAPEMNPYLTDKGRAGDGAGFPLGTAGVEASGAVENEVVGIDIVADEIKDGFISAPTRSLLMQLSEMGVLYRRVTGFIKVHQADGPSSKSGMVIQSLCHFLHHELSDYHRMLAVLESQMSLTSEGSGSAGGAGSSSSSPEGSGLTLLRLGLWTEDMKLKMRLMEMVVEDASKAHGGALVSKIHSRTKNGDPFARHFMDELLEEVSKPFFLALQRWILSGELHDPFNEFFVQLNKDIESDQPSAYAAGDAGFEEGFDIGGNVSDSHHLWEKKYAFVKAMVPGFISEDFAKKIFSTGRSLNFIRYNCYDTDWVQTQAGLGKAGTLKYSDLNGLERSIDDAYSSASKRLLEIFFDKYKLLDHLRALKAYLMLGAGDFAELLMEALAPRLSKPAISLYRHHLTSDLESAIRGSNAQFDSPDVLRRLDARILEYQHGELGWDCFALEYKVEAPLNAVLDARAMDAYDRLFHHFWRLKRVETALTQGWMRVTSASRAFESLPNLDNDWHHCRIVQAEMVHFLRQLQAFYQLEVIECSWQVLLQYTEKPDGDLDSLIAHHRTYLDRVVSKILLLGSRGRDDALLLLVREAMDNILRFRTATEDLYAWSLGEATRLDRTRDAERGITGDVSTDAAAGGAGSEDTDDVNASLEQLDGIRDRIRICATGFQDAVTTLCKEAGLHADLDVRFLAIRIAFNGHYALRRGASRKAKEAAGEKK